jgi:DNA helicase-2/ATP-dependent DNA helicase PcrA
VGTYLNTLNEEQAAAVLTTEGAVRVLAGAGTGKTRALTDRFCYLVAELGIAPKNILCATFTNRAASEMKRRARAVLGDLDLGYICTFHAFCVQLLKEDIHVLHYPDNFLIFDVEDQKEILLKIFADMRLTLRDTTVKRTIDEVLEAKKMYASTYIDDIYEPDSERLKERFAAAKNRDEEIFFRYLYEQKKNFACDFNDLINFSAYILEKFPAVRQKWQDRMQYVMIDEFQDVSGRQYNIARQLAGKHGNLFIVGDPDQTIYSWRGSHVKLFLDFTQVYPGAKTIILTQNYRSTPDILRAADAVIEHNRVRCPKHLAAVRAAGEMPLYRHAGSEKEEAAWIAAEIKKLRDNGVPLGAAAVLYRAHYLTRALEECFTDKGLPYKIFSGVEFYGRREIKDVICYLRMVTAGDDVAFLRTVNTPPRKIGKKKLEKLREYAEQTGLSLYDALKETRHTDLWRGTGAARYAEAIEYVREKRRDLSLGNILETLLARSGYAEFLRLQADQERLDNVAELKRSVETFGQDEDAALEDFLARAALFTNIDRDDARETIKLMTVHTAKGLEFPYVFICGLNEGVFPSRRIGTPEEMEEERRLVYVAMTRARDRLFLSDCEGVGNDGLFKYPSRFIFEAGRENIEYAAPLDKTLEETARRQIEHSEKILENLSAPFQAGERVNHSVFGRGTVLTVRAGEGCYAVLFDGLPTERSIQFGAPLARQEE